MDYGYYIDLLNSAVPYLIAIYVFVVVLFSWELHDPEEDGAGFASRFIGTILRTIAFGWFSAIVLVLVIGLINFAIYVAVVTVSYFPGPSILFGSLILSLTMFAIAKKIWHGVKGLRKSKNENNQLIEPARGTPHTASITNQTPHSWIGE